MESSCCWNRAIVCMSLLYFYLLSSLFTRLPRWQTKAVMVGGVARWHVGTLARWDVGTLARWHVGTLARWHVGGLAGWRVGGVADWRVGTLARAPLLERYQDRWSRLEGRPGVGVGMDSFSNVLSVLR